MNLKLIKIMELADNASIFSLSVIVYITEKDIEEILINSFKCETQPCPAFFRY